MPLKDLSDRIAVLRAIEEYDRLGPEDFHSKYGFGPSLKFPLVYEGKRYPSKAIAAVAYSIQYPDRPLLTEESTPYSGGTATVVPKLQELGFVIENTPDRASRRAENVASRDFFGSVLQEILDLQPHWVSTNSPEMQRRGELIRRRGPELLRAFLPELGHPPTDLEVEGRDGTGRKTRIPWIRVYSSERSPSATTGWYLVYLFARDGSKVFLSLNQGSTQIEGKQYVARPDSFIRDRVAWALDVLGADVLEERPYLKSIDLRDSGYLAAAYEKSHVLGIEYESREIPTDVELRQDLRTMLPLLVTLYEIEDSTRPATARASEGRPIHLVVKWSPSHAPDTVERHSEIASVRGAVWWGVFTSGEKQKVGGTTLGTLREQLQRGVHNLCVAVWPAGSSRTPGRSCRHQ